MTDYVKSTNFASKDSLSIGNPLKIVKGTEIDAEFNNIATAVATKADLNSPALIGTPTAPTATAGTNTTQMATTAFVSTAVTNERTATATLTNKTLTSPTINTPTVSSPTMTGTPVAPTASAGTNTTQVATTAFVRTALQAVYPVGSVYINASVTTNPATLLGFGTWVAFGAGRVMVGLNGSDTLFDTLEETGGSKDSVVVAHTHEFSGTTSSASLTGTFPTSSTFGSYSGVFSRGSALSGNGGDPNTNYQVNINATHTHTVSGTTDSTGSSGTNANLQPYITVAVWKRTA